MPAAQADQHAQEVLAGYREWFGAPGENQGGGGADGPWGAGVGMAGDGTSADGDIGDEASGAPAPGQRAGSGDRPGGSPDEHEAIGTAWRAAAASFCFFASGAIIPVLPYLFGATGFTGQVIAAGLVGVALLLTGAVVGLLAGGPPVRRALRQLAIGYGAAAVTYGLGLLWGA